MGTIIGIILIALSLLKLAGIWSLVQWEWLGLPWFDYLGALAILYIGASMVFESLWGDRDKWLQRPIPGSEEGKRPNLSVSFGGDEYIYRGEQFHGARIEARFGGLRLDLRSAVINEDEEIDISTRFGGVELFVPADVNVQVQSRSFVGGVCNEARRNTATDTKCIHICANNVFGGVHINN